MLRFRPNGLLLFVLPFIFFCTVSIAAIPPVDYSKTDNGIIVNLKRKLPNGARRVQLQAITDKVIHVVATPLDTILEKASLIIEDRKRSPVKWDVKELDGRLLFSTGFVVANVNVETGEIAFTDKAGKPLLKEVKESGRTLKPVIVEGESSYELSQYFELSDGEAFYGLGQHQNGIMNYEGYQVELAQNNSDVAVPFLLSNKNYGILWDNYSITRAVDTRIFENLSSLKLYSAKNEQGWLTASYINRKTPSRVFTRPESTIDYEFLQDQARFPTEVKLADVTVRYEGFIESGVTGLHSILFKYGGYAKLWIDGKLLVDRWRQSWNPGSVMFKVPLEKGKKHAIKIEWDPDGGESYIVCKWLSPLEGAGKKQFGFASESGDRIDYYFVYGSTMDEVISGYRDITGKAPIVPKWAMGLWQSRERYKTQDEILNTVQEFRKRKIPLDNIVLDWSYWEQDKWGSQDFDSTRFPDPAAMIKKLHEQYNTKFMISVWPKFYQGIPAYDYFNKEGWLYKRNVAKGTRDWIAKGYISTFYDAFNPKARDAFWDLLNKKLYTKGVDAWWMDATEPDIHSNASIAEKKLLMTPTAIGSGTTYFNAFPLQNAAGIYNGQRKTNPDKRVFILTRSAYAGQQRYAAATWSGDISARWHDFKDQISAGVNFSMSGIPYWTVDIGGFAVEKRYERAKGEDLEEWREQMARWYQFGAFCPLFRVHGQFPFREIFNVAPEEHAAYQSMLYYDRLRYRLMPYLYSLSGKTYHDNYTIMRGLVMDFPLDEAVKNIADQYMFGPSLLINPVYEYKALNRKLYLPAGGGWYDLYSGKYENGGQQIVADAPTQRMPVYVKEGSIIPFGPAIQYSTEKQADTITLFVYTGKDASFNIYEDENLNYNYEKGAYANIPVTYSEKTKTLTIGERQGSFKGMLSKRVFQIKWIAKDRAVALSLEQTPDKKITYTGKPVSISMKQ